MLKGVQENLFASLVVIPRQNAHNALKSLLSSFLGFSSLAFPVLSFPLVLVYFSHLFKVLNSSSLPFQAATKNSFEGIGSSARMLSSLAPTPPPPQRHLLDYRRLHRLPSPPVAAASNIQRAPATRVLPFLYLGNERDAADLHLLRSLGVTRVLNVTAHLPGFHQGSGITYKRLPATDSGQQNLKQYFEEAFQFIVK
ncbi:hypothetical protein J437_LFUL014533 [Ladona fulva]|uniref:Uncharacterized protein n=1 Tax=Ladona fulva TaxID=123851 RepID=A0A8K0K4R9_LADFU|nr:hypothetical protein J437_LFUL014533 [Ladona fulva]